MRKEALLLKEKMGSRDTTTVSGQYTHSCTLITPFFKGTARDTNPMYLKSCTRVSCTPWYIPLELVVPRGTSRSS